MDLRRKALRPTTSTKMEPTRETTKLTGERPRTSEEPRPKELKKLELVSLDPGWRVF